MSDLKSPVLGDLEHRGLLKNATDLDGLDALLSKGGKVAVYAGFDATASSLHAGHLMSILGLKVFADHDHLPLAVIGTSTALVGDPTGRNTSRPKLDRDAVTANAELITRSLREIVGNDLWTAWNEDWLSEMQLTDFLLEVAGSISAARLLSLETFSERLKANNPLTAMELLYPLLQAADFLQFARWMKNQGFDAVIQLGGSDQWGNICVGLDVIARHDVGIPAFGLTTPLLTKADGTKMGKTAGGAAWLSRDMLDDQAFFQFWRDIEDERAPTLARIFAIEDRSGDINILKEKIAVAVTDLVRGTGEQMAAEARRIFAGKGTEFLPVVEILEDEANDLALVIVKAGLAPSKTRARTLIAQGGIRIDGERLETHASSIPLSLFADGDIRLSAGRKAHIALRLVVEE